MTTDLLRMAFLDDRPEAQETVINGLRPYVPKGWEIIACPLKPKLSDYVPWLHQNNVAVLLTDQMLDERATIGTSVNYKGHQVIETIRNALPVFPIIVATRATEDADLKNHFGDADDIVDRSALVKEAEFRVQRYTRLGQRFVETYRNELAELSSLATKCATKKLSKAERKRLDAIQTKLSMEVPIDSPLDNLIHKMTQDLNSLNNLSEKAANILSDIKKKSPKIKVTSRKKS